MTRPPLPIHLLPLRKLVSPSRLAQVKVFSRIMVSNFQRDLFAETKV